MSSIERARGRNGALVRQRFVDLILRHTCHVRVGIGACAQRRSRGRGWGRRDTGNEGPGSVSRACVGTRRCYVACRPCAAACDMRHPVAFLHHHAPGRRRGRRRLFRSGKNWSPQVLPRSRGAFEIKGAGVTVEGPIDRVRRSWSLPFAPRAVSEQTRSPRRSPSGYSNSHVRCYRGRDGPMAKAPSESRRIRSQEHSQE